MSLCYEDLSAELFGRYLRQRRDALGLTREEVAKRTGLSDKNLGKIERGEQYPVANTLYKLEPVLKIKISNIFEQIRKETATKD